MKRIISLSLSAFLLAFLFSCTSQARLSPEAVDKLVNSEEFTFMAEKAHPTGGDVINVLSSMRSTNILDLSYGDGIVFKDSLVQVHLPYFGRVYNPSYDTSKAGFAFESKDFELNKVKNNKGVWIIRFSPNDQQNVRYMQLEVFNNGTASLNVDANDRQSISYSGYILDPSTAKK